MAFTTVFFGLTITVVSEKRQNLSSETHPSSHPCPVELDICAHSGTPSNFGEVSGSDDRTSPQPAIPHHTAHPVGGISIPSRGWGCNNGAPLKATLLFVVTDDVCQQIYRMYYIYGRNRFAFLLSIVPAISTLALFGEFGFPSVLYSP
jgi:hypothetical protein